MDFFIAGAKLNTGRQTNHSQIGPEVQHLFGEKGDILNRVRHENRSGRCITSRPVSECMARDAKRCQFGRKLDSESQKWHGCVVLAWRRDQEEMVERA
jgi:hypothetical protein